MEMNTEVMATIGFVSFVVSRSHFKVHYNCLLQGKVYSNGQDDHTAFFS